MKVETFVNIIGSEFYAGVPDSQLKALCNYLMNTYGIDPKHHIIGANEGNCAALAAGYHLATGKIPVVYLQNSGEGNIINPVASLLNDKVYAIPMLFIVGWRGEPGIHDEPQHIYQGEITIKLLEDMDIKTYIVDKNCTEDELCRVMEQFREIHSHGKSTAFVIRKNALTYNQTVAYTNQNCMMREDIIRHIVKAAGEDSIISTTGKTSRELFEIRHLNGESHQNDFLTVGSMGHSSSIALGVALNKPDANIWCIDGDGAVLMHMGALAVIGHYKPENMIHVVINNNAHESVGGMPTVADTVDLAAAAHALGYPFAVSVNDVKQLNAELTAAKKRKALSFIEVKCAIGARENLGRPTTTALENKLEFMRYLERGISVSPKNLP